MWLHHGSTLHTLQMFKIVQFISHRIHVCYIYIYMVTVTINIPQMLAYIAYMDPMGMQTQIFSSPLDIRGSTLIKSQDSLVNIHNSSTNIYQLPLGLWCLPLQCFWPWHPSHNLVAPAKYPISPPPMLQIHWTAWYQWKHQSNAG